MLEFASWDSPTVGDAWRDLSSSDRDAVVLTALRDNPRLGIVGRSRCRDDGQIFLTLNEPLSAADRGVILRAVEAHLKNVVDQGVTVWVEPIGDKNSLRKLRGIEIRS